MFKHRDKERTFQHNVTLAGFLCFTAGIVNICGVLSLGILTTNVTGHFAYFAENILQRNISAGFSFLLYILAFLAGSFISSLLTEFALDRKHASPHNAALFIEIFLLLGIGLFGNYMLSHGISPATLAIVLLFTMGLQNSLVGTISSSSVRTTHLTGLFTDLGIELSQLFFYREQNQRKQLTDSIKLRGSIIAFFFLGCTVGGFLYSLLLFKILVLAAFTLMAALTYDTYLPKTTMPPVTDL
ncbi:MAG: DUF1275 domain-containing protein [Chitinophagales bacterium]|nr:DUF1275 domain-containing protein [Chitinophagales bacterium]